MQIVNFEKIDEILANHNQNSAEIIAVLQEIQQEYHYLPREIFPYISKRLGISTTKVYSVATFYENFSLDPKGKFVIKVCDGTACHVRKSIPILEKLRETLSLSESKKTTEDMLFTVETVSCLGACGLAPVITVNDKVHPAMSPEKVLELLTELREGEQND